MKIGTLLFVLLTSLGYAQKKDTLVKTIQANLITNEVRFTKSTSNIKYSPQQFFIVNDKPVDLETYQKQNKEKTNSSK